MRRRPYLEQLKRDIDNWVEEGLIDSALGPRLLAQAGPPAGTFPMRTITIVLGSLLIGLGILTFIASNWDGLSKVLKLTILLAGLWATIGLAAWGNRANRLPYIEASLLGTVLIFGVCIALIGQTFHLPADPEAAALLWTVGAAVVAVGGRSRAALTAGFVLAGIWSWSHLEATNGDPHWPYLGAWVVLAAVAVLWSWRLGFHLALLSLVAWSVLTGIACGETYDLDFPAAGAFFALAWLAVWLVMSVLKERPWTAALRPDLIQAYALIPFLAGLFFIQLPDEVREEGGITALTGWPLIVLPAVVAIAAALLATFRKRLQWPDAAAVSVVAILLALMAGGDPWRLWLFSDYWILAFAFGIVAFGWRDERTYTATLGFVLFGAQIVFIYFTTFSSLMDKTLLFTTSGVLLVVLGLALDRLRRLLLKKEDTP